MAIPTKPEEVEELVDLWIHRPLARGLVALLALTPVTPNQVTLLSALTGAASGFITWHAPGHPARLLAAAGLLLLSVVLDCSDGQLARIKQISSTYGAILDGIADYVVGVALAIGASRYMLVVHGSAWYVLLGAAGTASAALHAALFDHTKSRYLARIGGGYREREVDLTAVRRDYQSAAAERRWRDLILLWVYERYTRAQQAAFDIPATPEPEAWRAAHRGRMRLWTFLGIGTHFAIAYLVLVAAAWRPDAVDWFFLAALVPLNLLLAGLALSARQEQGP